MMSVYICNPRLPVAIVLLVQLWFQSVQGQNTPACVGARTPGELHTALLKDYDPFTRPGLAQAAFVDTEGNSSLAAFEPPPPDIARIQLHVLSLNAVDSKENEFKMSVWFRRSWQDFRLRYTPASRGGCFPDDGRVGFSEDILKDIWAPDFYIENQAKSSVEIAGSVWIYPSGRVVHVTQLELALHCQMQLADFPRDTQQCGFRVGTFLEDAREVTLDFYEGLEPVTLAQDSPDPNALPRGATTEWTIVAASGVNVTGTGGSTQVESAVEIRLDLQRNSDYYSDWVIAPTVSFVIIGWLSFFIDRSAAPARVTLAMIGFLANVNFLSGQLGQLPRLGDDVWLLTLLSRSSYFTFYAVFEYVVCNWLRRIEDRIVGARKKVLEDVVEARSVADKKSKKKKKKYDEELAEQSRMAITKDDIKESGFNYKADLLLMKSNTRMYIKDEHVDVFSRYAYPITYLIMFSVMWFTH